MSSLMATTIVSLRAKPGSLNEGSKISTSGVPEGRSADSVKTRSMRAASSGPCNESSLRASIARKRGEKGRQCGIARTDEMGRSREMGRRFGSFVADLLMALDWDGLHGARTWRGHAGTSALRTSHFLECCKSIYALNV